MDSDAFLQLWESNRTRISSRLYRLGVGDEAEDLLQDVFLRVYRLVVTEGLELDERYLMRAASSRAIDYGRTVAKKRGRVVPYTEELTCAVHENAHEVYVTKERENFYRRVVEPALESMPEKYRAAVRSFMDGEPQAELSRRTGIPPSTISSRTKRGLELLREVIDGPCPPQLRLAKRLLRQP